MDQYVERESAIAPAPPGIEIPEEFKALLCEPPLLRGEDADLYNGLLNAAIKDRNPKTFDDWVEINDHVTSLWEERRFRQASASLMRGEMFDALLHFLRKIAADGGLKKLGAPQELTFKYFSESARDRKQVVDLLARYGITDAVLQAKAAQINSGGVQMFEGMINRRVKNRRKLVKRKLH